MVNTVQSSIWTWVFCFCCFPLNHPKSYPGSTRYKHWPGRCGSCVRKNNLLQPRPPKEIIYREWIPKNDIWTITCNCGENNLKENFLPWGTDNASQRSGDCADNTTFGRYVLYEFQLRIYKKIMHTQLQKRVDRGMF